MQGLLRRMEKQGMEGENSSHPQLSFCSFLPLLSPFLPSILHAAANVWMLGWLGKTLSKIYFCWTILHSFFPLLTTLSTAGSSERLWVWESHTGYRQCCLKIRPRKQTPEIRVTCRPTLLRYLGVNETSELGKETIWGGGKDSSPGQEVSSRQEDGSSSSKTRSFWIQQWP